MRKKIVAITFEFNNNPTYISEVTKRSENTFLVTGTSTDPNEAHDFKSKSEAKGILIRLYNPFHREYKVTEVVINTSDKSFNHQERIA